jgi:CMP-N-acetylneuraminic acid synthetase
MTKKFAYLIPARGGSKGIPSKNIIDLNGKPLIKWTIDALYGIADKEDIYVSTDCDKIKKVVQNLRATIIDRPASISQDSSLSIEVVNHFLETINTSYENIVFLQPTSPLRRKEDIEKAKEIFIETKSSSLISINESIEIPQKSFIIKKNKLKGLINNEYPFLPRQQLESTFKSNGAIYIINVPKYLKKSSFYLEPCSPYLMDNERSRDVDDMSDLEYCRRVLRN